MSRVGERVLNCSSHGTGISPLINLNRVQRSVLVIRNFSDLSLNSSIRSAYDGRGSLGLILINKRLIKYF